MSNKDLLKVKSTPNYTCSYPACAGASRTEHSIYRRQGMLYLVTPRNVLSTSLNRDQGARKLQERTKAQSVRDLMDLKKGDIYMPGDIIWFNAKNKGPDQAYRIFKIRKSEKGSLIYGTQRAVLMLNQIQHWENKVIEFNYNDLKHKKIVCNGREDY